MPDPIEAAARVIYTARFPDAPVDEHFDWYRRYCDDKESGVHRSTVALAFRDASAAIDAYEAAMWRPIEEAPRNGDEIIGFREDQGVFTFRWSSMEELVEHDAAGDPIEEYNEDFADWWHDRWGWMERELRPTKFRPLPEPPKAASAIAALPLEEMP